MFVLILSLSINTSYSDYVYLVKPEEPYLLEEISILEVKNQEEIVYRWSAWFQYLPLSSSTNAQQIGILDSNCYHLFSSIEQKSKSLNFLHYDCVDNQQMKILKIIQFIGNDDLQYSFEIIISNFEYENQWYYFDFIYFLYMNKFQIILIKNEQIFKDEILNVLPFKDVNLLQKVGGDLEVTDSKINNIKIKDKFATFPGKILYLQNDQNIKNFAEIGIYLTRYLKTCKCQNNPINKLMDSDFFQMNTLIYTSKYPNCNSFIISGWFKINEIIQIDEEMTYQFLKLTSNKQNSQLQNQNLTPLQFYYKISQANNQILLTTYSFTFPSVTLDFKNDPFLITKQFDIINNIKLWHLIYIGLTENNLDINIKFYDRQQVFEYKEQIQVNQFHQIYYKLFLGNYLSSTTNYLNIQGRNLYFFNCMNNFQQKNCHVTCSECDGPTNQDCLTCSTESQRIYISEYKQCICPYSKIDDEDQCKDYSDFEFQLTSKEQQNNEDCSYGYFELNDVCYQCPGLINTETKTCLECLLNPKDWYKNPFCSADLFLKQDGTTSELKEDIGYKQYYTFNGKEVELCLECQESNIIDEINIIEDISFKYQSFKQFCITGDSSDQCYKCSQYNCITCAVSITGQICLSCEFTLQLNDGHCTNPNLGKFLENNCLSPYYISSSMECKLCSIDNCKYCFEYVEDDLSLCTLYKDFQQFNGDDNLKVGCAMCEADYIYDFQMGLCLNQNPKIESCLRSYINLQGEEICTLSSKQDFSISREIINCEQFISNCLQCFLTTQSILRCIICKEGYTSSTTEVNGQCNISRKQYQIISIEGHSYLKDAWVQMIQSFLQSFLPNQYFYPLTQNTYLIDEIAITCKEGYQLAKSRYCVQYCKSNCLDCKLNSLRGKYFCNLCELDYYKQPKRSQNNGACLTCSPLCVFCQQRSVAEINQAQPYFISTEDNQAFSSKCFSPVQDPNVIISSKQFVPIYCLDKSCQNSLLYEFFNSYCSQELLLIDNLLSKVLILYLNQIGIKKITIQLNYPQPSYQCDSAITINSISLKQNIFSLQSSALIINGNQALFARTISQYLIQHFDSIQMLNFSINLYNNSISMFSDTKLTLSIQNVQFLGIQLFQINQLLNSQLYDSIDLVNITFSDAIFSESSLLHLDSQNFRGQLFIKTLTILNSTFLNSNLIMIKNSQLSIYVQNLYIENCKLVNSSILNVYQNLSISNSSKIQNVIVKNCNLTQSYLFYFIGQMKLDFVNLQLLENSLYDSTYLTLSFNTSIIDLLIKLNYIDTSSLLQTHEINITEYYEFSFDNVILQDITLKKSNLFQLASNSYFNNLILQSNNLYLENIKQFSNTNYQYFIFIISSSYQCKIQSTQILDIRNLSIFYFFESNDILFENLTFQSNLQKVQVDFSQSCRQLQSLQNQLLKIQGFINFKLQKVEINNQQIMDSSFIEITSPLQYLVNIKESIQMNDIIFKRNIIEKNQIGMQSLISIYSEKQQFIRIQNLVFVNNFYHQYYDDPNENFAGLIYIRSPQGIIEIDNINSQENAITNSSASFIHIISQSIFITNYVISYHNIIRQQLWNEFYNFKINEQYNQDSINQIIQQIYPINVNGGAAKIVSQNFQCRNSTFKNILAFTSAIFEIKTQGQGLIKLVNVSSNQIFNIKRDSIDNSGSMNVNSQNSNLNLELVDLNFQNVQNGMSTAILSINPSQRKNQIVLRNLQIINCFSFLNQVLSIQFSTYNNQNVLSIQNVTIIIDEIELIKYFSKYDQFSQTEISQILSDNSIFNVVGGLVYINKVYVQGIILSTIFKMINIINLEISDCYMKELQSYYPLQLILVNQQQNSILKFEKITIQKFSIQQLNSEQQQVQKVPSFRVLGCQLQQLSEQYLFNSKIIIMENIQSLLNQQLNISYSLIQISSLNSQSIQIFKKINIIQNNCQNYTKGILQFELLDFRILKIEELQCHNNYVQEHGCLYIKADKFNSQRKVIIYHSTLIQNNGSQGSALEAENIRLIIKRCMILGNYASKAGGGIYLNIEKNGFKIYQTFLMLNKAKKGGGIYLTKDNLNQNNFYQSFLQFNYAELQTNNLVEAPTHLSVFINQMEMQSKKQYVDNYTISISKIQPFDIIEQGLALKAQQLMIPSNQQINNYKIYIPKLQVYRNYLEVISIQFKNGLNENLEIQVNSSCLIQTTIHFENKSIASEEVTQQILAFDIDSKVFQLGSLSFSFDPYFQDDRILQIGLNCTSELNQEPLLHYIYAKTLKCQLGEFYVDKGCQVCQSNQGFYSITYNATKCSIFDKEKYENITSNRIKLYGGFWRPSFLSDYTESCFKNPNFCQGGWEAGDKLCSQGHIGGLCEECDNFNIKGDGMFYKNVQNLQCLECNQIQDSILPFLLTLIWAIFSILITLRSIDKSNRLFSSLKIRQRFSKIIFKLDQDHESILIKMLLNYLWIYSVVFTFNTNFSFSLNFIELTSNSSFFMANNLDCYLSQLQFHQLLYIRIIAMLLLIVLQSLIIWAGFTIYALCKKTRFDLSIISNTLLYLYVSNYAALIKQFCSIVFEREISNIIYIQGDVSLIYGTKTHFSWVIGFAIPSLGIIGLLIPFSLFFVMYINKDQFDKIKLRRHICYLFNEYNTESYYWEQIKLSKKTIIIIILTYFESNVLLKASLLGLCLLFYQLFAVKQKPYIIQSLNFLDIQTGQICSITIFIAAAKYVSEQENNIFLSVLLQIIIVLLCFRLCYPFIINIFRVYYKKYKVQFIGYCYKLLRFIKANSFLTIYINKKLKSLNYSEQRKRNNFAKLRCHLIQISKVQIGHQKQMITMINSQSTIRYRQTITDVEMNKLISP